MPAILRLPFRKAGFAACLLTLVAATFSLPAPARAYDADSQAWAQFLFNARLPDSRVRLFAESQLRQGNDYRNLSQLLLRPAVGYQVNRKMSVWLGYGFTPSFLPDYNSEHRVFQQLLFEDRYRRWDVTNRTRLEERSIEGAGGTVVRLRHWLRLSHPLDPAKRWAIVGSNEVMWNLNGTPKGPQSGFDQNRAHVGIARTLSPHTRVEVGYLASFVNPPRARPDRRLDVLLMTVNYNL